MYILETIKRTLGTKMFLLWTAVEPDTRHIIFISILTHTSNAKCFRNVTLINIRGLTEIIVPVRDYDRHSPNQVMIKGND